jgi:hypothetical protein
VIEGDPRANHDQKLQRRDPVLIACGAVALMSALVIGVAHRVEWHVGLLLCGVAIGTAGILFSQLLFRVGATMSGSGDAEPETDGSPLGLGHRVAMVAYAVVGIYLGVVCASFDLDTLELVVFVLLALLWVGTFGMLVVRGRARSRPET